MGHSILKFPVLYVVIYILTVECFLEVILLIYCFKRVNFLFENGIVESKTCKQYGRHKGRAEFNPGLMNKSNDD